MPNYEGMAGWDPATSTTFATTPISFQQQVSFVENYKQVSYANRCAGRRNSGLFFLFHPLKKMIYISFVQKKRTLMTSSSYDVYGCIDQLFTYKQTMLISGRRCADVRRCIQHLFPPHLPLLQSRSEFSARFIRLSSFLTR